MSLIPERYAAYETTATIGVVNFTSVVGDVPATLEKVEANVREAGAQGVDILVFPEEALIGLGDCAICREGADHCDYHHDAGRDGAGAVDRAHRRPGAELDIYVVFGMVERDADDPEVLYNAAAFVGPDGIQGTYRKLHLGSLPWVSEGVTFTPGDAAADLRDPLRADRRAHLLRLLVQPGAHAASSRSKGARLIVNCCATFTGPGKRDYMVHTTSTRAQENLCYVGEREPRGRPERRAGATAPLSSTRAAPPTSSATARSPAPRFRASVRCSRKPATPRSW